MNTQNKNGQIIPNQEEPWGESFLLATFVVMVFVLLFCHLLWYIGAIDEPYGTERWVAILYLAAMGAISSKWSYSLDFQEMGVVTNERNGKVRAIGPSKLHPIIPFIERVVVVTLNQKGVNMIVTAPAADGPTMVVGINIPFSADTFNLIQHLKIVNNGPQPLIDGLKTVVGAAITHYIKASNADDIDTVIMTKLICEKLIGEAFWRVNIGTDKQPRYGWVRDSGLRKKSAAANTDYEKQTAYLTPIVSSDQIVTDGMEVIVDKNEVLYDERDGQPIEHQLTTTPKEISGKIVGDFRRMDVGKHALAEQFGVIFQDWIGVASVKFDDMSTKARRQAYVIEIIAGKSEYIRQLADVLHIEGKDLSTWLATVIGDAKMEAIEGVSAVLAVENNR